MPETTRDKAWELLVRALAFGPASKAGLREAMSASPLWSNGFDRPRLVKGVTMVMTRHELLDNGGFDEEFGDWYPDWYLMEEDVVRSAFMPDGFYVFVATFGGEDALCSAHAYFLPYGVCEPDGIVTLFDFDLGATRAGRDLRAALVYGPDPDRPRDGYMPVKPAARRLWEANVGRAFEAVRLHAEGRRPWLAQPPLQVPADIQALVADPYYPTQRLRDMWCMQFERWVHAVPDRGHYVFFAGPDRELVFLTLEGNFEFDLEHLDLQMLFRVTDEDVDPGLAERIELALQRLRETHPVTEDIFYPEICARDLPAAVQPPAVFA